MMRPKLSITVLPLAIVLGAALRPTGAPAPQDAAPGGLVPVLAVVDLDRVSKGYPRATQLFDDVKQMAAELEERVAKEEKALKVLQGEAQAGFDAYTEAWSDARAKYEGAKATLEAMVRSEQARLQHKSLEVKEKVYQEIDRAVQELAAKRRLQLVLRLRAKPGDKLPLEDRLQQWSERDVLVHEPLLDITDDVIKLLIAGSGAGTAVPGDGK